VLQTLISTLFLLAVIIMSGVIVWHVAAPMIFAWLFIGIPAIVRFGAPIICEVTA